MIKETKTKQTHSTRTREYIQKPLSISFTQIIEDNDFGLLSSSNSHLNDKIKIQKIVKTLMLIREKTAGELIQTPKNNNLGGCEKCNISAWNWKSDKIKSFLQDKSTIYIIRAGDSRIFGSIYDNCFYIHCIEYALNTIYKHS